jgi:hypothetical protein
MESQPAAPYARSFAHAYSIDGQSSLSQLIRNYKRITAKMAGIRWQRDFFDHRLRHDESLAEKFAYISQSPVRAGLIHSERDWPYVFIPESHVRKAVR